MSRTVTIHLTQGEVIEIGRATDFDKFWCAIGYLATWGNAPKVHIYRDRERDLYATYTTTGSKPLVIGAVWNGADFGFHM